MGTDIEPVPVTGLAANFSPMPRMAPPSFGSEIGPVFGADAGGEFAPPRSALTVISGAARVRDGNVRRSAGDGHTAPPHPVAERLRSGTSGTRARRAGLSAGTRTSRACDDPRAAGRDVPP